MATNKGENKELKTFGPISTGQLLCVEFLVNSKHRKKGEQFHVADEIANELVKRKIAKIV